MKCYVFLDEDGYAYSSGMSLDIPEGATEVDKFYEIIPPSAGFKFDIQSEIWVDCRGEFEKAAQIRMQRNDLLAKTDWTQGEDVTQEIKQNYAVYRQELRDVTKQEGFPESVSWPTPP